MRFAFPPYGFKAPSLLSNKFFFLRPKAAMCRRSKKTFHTRAGQDLGSPPIPIIFLKALPLSAIYGYFDRLKPK
jgi:hypothetical protein